MRDFLIFIAGAAFAFVFILFFSALDIFDRYLISKQEKRPGYISFTFPPASNEGRDASANPDEAEGPSGGGHVTPPPHLRIVRGGEGERHADMP